jgi:hypothetical protein
VVDGACGSPGQACCIKKNLEKDNNCCKVNTLVGLV